jgi:hypothetical protein
MRRTGSLGPDAIVKGWGSDTDREPILRNTNWPGRNFIFRLAGSISSVVTEEVRSIPEMR